MNIPKRHHFVPELLLKRFCDKNGELWHFNKKAPHLGVESGIPKKVFHQRHYYSLDENGVKDTTLETWFSRLETNAEAVIEKICQAARSGQAPGLSDTEKKVWDLFLYYQWKRTPDSVSATISDADFENILSESIADFEDKFRKITDEERSRLLSISNKEKMYKNARVRAIANPGSEVQAVLDDMGIAIAVIHKSNKSFVIGSKTVTKLTPPDETRLGQPGVEMWLPVAADVAVCMIPGKGREILHELNDDVWLRHFNSVTFRESTIIAGRSRALISSLVSAK